MFRIVIALLTLPACKPPSTQGPTPEPKTPSPPLASGWSELSVQETLPHKKAALKLSQSLKASLIKALQSGGPDAGVRACTKLAPKITQQVAKAEGIEMGRTSFKVRNPANQAPDFVKPIVLARWDKPVAMKGPLGETALVQPITLGAACLACHGPKETLADSVKQALAQAYPDDRATGFEVGNLRGWIWALKVPEAHLDPSFTHPER